MSKRKPEPGMWRWYYNPWLGEYACPFKPTLIEFIWLYLGAPTPVRDVDWECIESRHKACLSNKCPNVYKSRGRDDVKEVDVVHEYGQKFVTNVMDYARTRDKRPLRKPAAMTFEHFL